MNYYLLILELGVRVSLVGPAGSNEKFQKLLKREVQKHGTEGAIEYHKVTMDNGRPVAITTVKG